MSDLLPNTAPFDPYAVPEEDDIATKHEKAQVLEAFPALEKIVEWFNKQIDECDRLSTLDHESKLSLEAQIAGRQYTAQLLTQKQKELQAIVAQYSPRK